MNWNEFWKDFKPFIVRNVFFQSLIDKLKIYFLEFCKKGFLGVSSFKLILLQLQKNIT